MILPIDEIRSIPYKEYFGIMNLTEKQKKDRIAFAERLEDELLLMYELFGVLSDYSVTDDNLIIEQLKQAYLSVAESFETPLDDYMMDVADKFANDFVETTKKHIALKIGQDIPTDKGFAIIMVIVGGTVILNEYMDDGNSQIYEMPYRDVLMATNDGWFISPDRAVFNAENEANTVLNYKDYKEAKGNFKTWITENDERVRPTHIPLEGEKIPIGDLFVVGEALMRFPKDLEYAADYPEEIVNCRCSIKYS